jgi:hypothetical protein
MDGHRRHHMQRPAQPGLIHAFCSNWSLATNSHCLQAHPRHAKQWKRSPRWRSDSWTYGDLRQGDGQLLPQRLNLFILLAGRARSSENNSVHFTSLGKKPVGWNLPFYHHFVNSCFFCSTATRIQSENFAIPYISVCLMCSWSNYAML